MTTRHLLAPAYRDAAAVIPAFDLDDRSVADIRDGLVEAYEQAYGHPDAVQKEVVSIPREAGSSTRALLYRPGHGPVRGAILHVHGGGWIAGHADMFAGFCAGLSNRHAVVVLSVDYRLIPEAPGSAALSDCLSGLEWLRDHAATLGFEADRISVLGDSAGGNLCAALALRARDTGISLRGQILLYPALDDRTGGPEALDENPYAGEFVLTRKYLRQLWSRRLEGVAPEDLPYLAPARMEDVGGVAPAYLAVGSLDILVDEIIAYAGRLGRAGVPVELHVFDGVFHAFDLVPGPETDAFKADVARVVEKTLA